MKTGRIKTIMGVNIEERWQRRAECSIVILRQEPDLKITVLSCENYQGYIVELIDKVIESIKHCPESIDEIMAGNDMTMNVLQAYLSAYHLLNMPRRNVPSGEHVMACIERLRQQV